MPKTFITMKESIPTPIRCREASDSESGGGMKLMLLPSQLTPQWEFGRSVGLIGF